MNIQKRISSKIKGNLHASRPWLSKVDTKRRILEIGPLCSPNIKKEPDVNVFYADIRSTEDIKKFYSNDINVPLDKVVEIDYIIETSYSECFEKMDKFDYVIATHVIEHIPQLILFFQDISKILNQNGKLCLSIPDKRFCFDHFRYPTSFAESYDIYIKGNTNNPVRVFDHLLNYTINDPVFWWKNRNSFEQIPKTNERLEIAKNLYIRSLDNEYIDVHFNVFTPNSFLVFLYNMLSFNLLPFRCIEFSSTEYNMLEFNCVLEFDSKILLDNSIEKENILKMIKNNQDFTKNIKIKKIYWTIKNILKKTRLIKKLIKKLKEVE
jgi:SAM-dependent methyltransferase